MFNLDRIKEYLSTNSANSVQIGYQSVNKKEIQNFGESKIDSVYDIASISKVVMTTYLVMMAYDKKLLKLEDKVSKFFNFKNREIENITLLELLSHTSGLRGWIPFYLSSHNSFLEIIEHETLNNKNQRVYSDLGFILLGKVLEKIFEAKLNFIFKENVIDPLKLKNTFFEKGFNSKKVIPTSIGNPFEKNLSKSLDFVKDFDWRDYRLQGEVNDGNCHHYFKGVSGHCGLFSNCEDLLMICDSMKNHNCFSYFTSIDIQKNGLGFLKDKSLLKFSFSDATLGHHGFTGCSLFLDPKEHKNLIFLSNRQFGGLNESSNYLDWKNYYRDLIL